MNLRQQLEQHLPSLLPSDPNQALKGTELIRLVRLRLEGDYSDASLRFHFSTLAGDPTSSLAKVEKSQGYYKRPEPVERPFSSLQQPMLTSLLDQNEGEETPLEIQRQKKLLALALLHYGQSKLSPYLLTPPVGEAERDPWIVPPLLLADAPVAEDETGLHQDAEALRTRQLLGLPPLPLHSASLALTATPEYCRLQFFRALSASAWTHSGELIYAEAVTDDVLVHTLRSLGVTYGLGVTSLGLSLEQLDSLPSSAEIMEADPARMESLLERLDPVIIVPCKVRSQPDPFALEAVYKNAPYVGKLLSDLHGMVFS